MLTAGAVSAFVVPPLSTPAVRAAGALVTGLEAAIAVPTRTVALLPPGGAGSTLTAGVGVSLAPDVARLVPAFAAGQPPSVAPTRIAIARLPTARTVAGLRAPVVTTLTVVTAGVARLPSAATTLAITTAVVPTPHAPGAGVARVRPLVSPPLLVRAALAIPTATIPGLPTPLATAVVATTVVAGLPPAGRVAALPVTIVTTPPLARSARSISASAPVRTIGPPAPTTLVEPASGATGTIAGATVRTRSV